MPIREYSPLCLGEGLRWGKAIEVGRGSAPYENLARSRRLTQLFPVTAKRPYALRLGACRARAVIPRSLRRGIPSYLADDAARLRACRARDPSLSLGMTAYLRFIPSYDKEEEAASLAPVFGGEGVRPARVRVPRSGSAPTIDLAAVPDPQDEVTVGRSRVDDPVVSDAKAEEARKLTRQRLAGLTAGLERLFDLRQNTKSGRPIESVEVAGNRRLVVNPCAGQAAS